MANNAYMAQYRKEKQKQINFAQSIDYIDKLEEYCKARGLKKNTFIKLCIDKEMQLHPIEQYTNQLEEGEREEQTEERIEEKDMKTEQKDDTQKQIKEAIEGMKREVIQAIIDGLHAIE